MKNSTTTKKDETVKKSVAQPTTALKKEIERKHMVDAKSTAAEQLRALFVDGLKDIYWAEKR